MSPKDHTNESCHVKLPNKEGSNKLTKLIFIYKDINKLSYFLNLLYNCLLVFHIFLELNSHSSQKSFINPH
jgi:hypothetical protein